MQITLNVVLFYGKALVVVTAADHHLGLAPELFILLALNPQVHAPAVPFILGCAGSLENTCT